LFDIEVQAHTLSGKRTTSDTVAKLSETWTGSDSLRWNGLYIKHQ